VSGPVLLFCAPRLVLGVTEGVRSTFHVFHSRTRFGRFRGRRVPISFFALQNSFSTVPRASGPIFMFCAPGFVLGSTPVFFFSLPDPFWAVPRALGSVFMLCATGLVFGCDDGSESRFHVLPSRTHFHRDRGHRVPFACSAISDIFSVVPRASGSAFKFCPPELVLGGTEGVRYNFHILHSRTHFRRN
jgi:hypothetical protein